MNIKKELEKYFENYKRFYPNKIEKYYPELFAELNSSGFLFTEYAYRIWNDINQYPLCPICKCEIKEFVRWDIGYKKHCSQKCSQKSNIIKGKRTNLERYGEETPWGFGGKGFKNSMKEKYGKENAFEVDIFKEKIKQTNVKKYGTENPGKFGGEIFINTIKEKYNVDNVSKLEEIKEKKRKTCILNYGVDSYFKSKKAKDRYNNKEWVKKVSEKGHKTKKKNGTYGKSKVEDKLYNLLLEKFDKVERQYNIDIRYPFACDFYIPSLDLFIEYQGWWMHGGFKYDKACNKSINQLNIWKQKAKNKQLIGIPNNKNQFISAINIWTKIDVKKRKIAEKINWKEFFNEKEFMEWYDEL